MMHGYHEGLSWVAAWVALLWGEQVQLKQLRSDAELQQSALWSELSRALEKLQWMHKETTAQQVSCAIPHDYG